MITHRPSEGEGQHQLPSVGIGQGEGVAAEHGSRRVPKGARSCAGDVALVLLEAQPEEGVARRRAPRRRRRTRRAAATLAARQLAARVRHLQNLQFKEARS